MRKILSTLIILILGMMTIAKSATADDIQDVNASKPAQLEELFDRFAEVGDFNGAALAACTLQLKTFTNGSGLFVAVKCSRPICLNFCGLQTRAGMDTVFTHSICRHCKRGRPGQG